MAVGASQGTSIQAELVDERGEIVDKNRTLTVRDGKSHLVRGLAP